VTKMQAPWLLVPVFPRTLALADVACCWTWRIRLLWATRTARTSTWIRNCLSNFAVEVSDSC